MKILEQSFKVKGQRGYMYNIITRIGMVVLASQTCVEFDEIKEVGYEVFVVQQYPDRWSPDGKTFIPAKEVAPSSEQWGRLGFSFKDIELAKTKFDQLRFAHKEKKIEF